MNGPSAGFSAAKSANIRRLGALRQGAIE